MALPILLRKHGIKVVNWAPRSPQIQCAVGQANGSTGWADGLLDVTVAMNTQKYSPICCALAELLF